MSTKGKRIQFRVAEKYSSVINFLKEKTSAASISEVMRNSLGAYLWVVVHLLNGHRIVAKKKVEPGEEVEVSNYPDPGIMVDQFDKNDSVSGEGVTSNVYPDKNENTDEEFNTKGELKTAS